VYHSAVPSAAVGVGEGTEERVEALSLFGRPDTAVDGVALAEVQPPDLRRAHIAVVGAGEIVVLLATEEAEALFVDIEATFAELFDLGTVEGAGDGQEQVGPPQALRFGELEASRDGGQLLGGAPLQLHEGELVTTGLACFEEAGFTANEERLSHAVPRGGCSRLRWSADCD
jgi:hypothetical protein